MTEIKTLEKIDWDFAEAITGTSTNSFHPYPAKFIPQIPHHFIKSLSQEGDTVYDPFLGSGTTALEANILGRNAIGNDVNELAVLISKVKTTPICENRLRTLDDLVNRIYNRISLFILGKENEIEEPEIVNLKMWFKDFVIAELVIIKDEIGKLSDKDLVDFCLVALSGIIINVSHQDSDTRYVRVNKSIKPGDTCNRFIKQLSKLRKLMIDSKQLIDKGKSELKVADSRMFGIFPQDSAALAVTSPPYPNAYDYHLYHKYRLYWLGMDIRKLRLNEIGAHSDYSKKNGPDEFDFKLDMEKCFINISNILKPGSYFVIVIGDSILQGRKIQNNEILKAAAQSTALSFVSEFSRNLKLSKKSFNPKVGNIKTEKIIIFQNLK